MFKKLALTPLCALFLIASAQAQTTVNVSGYVRDLASGEELINASISHEEGNSSVPSNAYGFFSLRLPAGPVTLRVSMGGYETVLLKYNLTRDTSIVAELSKKVEDMETVTIRTSVRRDNVRKIEMSTQRLSGQAIKKIPAFLGEVDVVRSIQLLPGVSSVGEGSSGFNVRGGSTDQNLILLDEAPVFNSSHLFGFFSIFNPDVVKDVQLVKGGIGANYGGRLSSIVDVRSKDGNKKEVEGSGGVGTIFSRFSLEGPIIKDKASFVVAARRSYIDVLAKPFLASQPELKDSRFNFYDLSGKANFTLGKKDRLYIAGYLGNDVFGAGDQIKFIWGNTTLSTRWNHVFSDKLFMNLTYFYSKYDYNLGFGDRDNSFDWYSNIFNYSAKPEFTWYLSPKNTVTFGGQSTYYVFRPGRATSKQAGGSFNFSLPDRYSWENALFVTNDQQVSKRISLRYGIRWSSFDYLGRGKAYYYSDPAIQGFRRQLDSVRDFGQNKSIAFYNFFEPRFAFKYQTGLQSSVKISYNRMAQYLHLLSNTAASSPLDVWMPSTNNVKPQLADQIAAGYFKNFGKDDGIETSVEVYYKDLQNQVDYIDGADLLLNEYIEADLLYGRGRAYGVELYIKKSTGKLNGWISYTLARSERRVDGINNDGWFPTRFDRAHNLYVVASYQLNKKWQLGGSFVFSTGTPATFPTNLYQVQGFNIPHNVFGARNNYRNPAYNRLDFSATMQGKKKEKWKSEWVFGVYNSYARQNPYSVYFRTDPNDATRFQSVKFIVIGSIVPAISYNFSF
jgi:hypothetical protein